MTNRTPDLTDYTFTDLVIWDPRFPYYGDSAPIGGSYPMDCFAPLRNSADAEQANDDGTLYLLVPHCSGGDYCGTAVDLANYREFVELFHGRPGVVGTTGYPGVFGVVVKLSTLDNDDEMRETVNALYNYPCINDERTSVVEREIIEESISDFYDDARGYLIARYDNATVADAVEDAIDAMDFDVFMRELEIIGADIGEYWVVETCTSAYFDVEKIVNSMSDATVAGLLDISPDALVAKPNLPLTEVVAKPNLPLTEDLAQLVSAIIVQNMVEFELAEEWRKEHEDDDGYSGDDTPEYGYDYVDLTVGINTEGTENEWGYQTGDNSYTGGAYGHSDWAVVSLSKDSDSAEVAADIRDQLSELFYQR